VSQETCPDNISSMGGVSCGASGNNSSRGFALHASAWTLPQGVLSKRGREKELARLTDDEVAKIEASYANAFPAR
jgi:hypothetical protein